MSNSRILKWEIALWTTALLLPVIISVAFHFNGLYGQDAYAYLEMTSFLHKTVDLDSSIHFFWPIFYPFIGSIFSIVLNNDLLGLRLVSILSYSLSAFLFSRIIDQLYHAPKFQSLIYTSLFFVLSPYVFRFSTLVMSDMLCLFLILTSTYYSLKESNKTSIAITFIAGVLAVSTRYASIFIVAIPLLFLILKLLKQRRTVLLFIACLSILLGVIPQLYYKGINPGSLFNHGYLLNWSPMNFFMSSFSSTDIMSESFTQSNIISLIINALSPAFCFATFPLVVALFVFRKQLKSTNRMILFMVVTYLIFIVGIPVQNSRYLLLSFPFILILLFPAFNIIVEKVGRIHLLYGIIIVVQALLTTYAMRNPILWSQEEKVICEKVDTSVSPKVPIYTSGLEGPLKYYMPNHEINGLFVEFIDFPGHFNLIVDSNQIANQNPELILVKNFKKAFSEFTIIDKKHISQKWTLYEFER